MTADELKGKIEAYEDKMSELERRIEDLEIAHKLSMPITTVTPNEGLDEVKKKLNYVINYINIGVRNG